MCLYYLQRSTSAKCGMQSLGNVLTLLRVARWRAALVALVLLVALVVIGPFFVPVRPLRDTVPPQDLADPDSHFIAVNGLQIHYKTAGAGQPAIVLLHGFGASVFSWREVMEPLAALGTVVAYDRPAFGLTERPLTWEEDANPYTPEAQVELVVGLIDVLRLNSVILVGNSAGGAVAVQTALEHPERLEALVLVSPAIYEGGGAPGWIRPLLNTPQLDRIGPLLARQISQRGDALLESAWYAPSAITPDIRAGYRRSLQADNWDRALWELTKASRRPGLTDHLQNIRMSALVVTGDDDRIVPADRSVRLAGELPNAELVVIPNCGHVPQEECPDPFLDAVINYIDGLPLGVP